jgi:hypothetical protein
MMKWSKLWHHGSNNKLLDSSLTACVNLFYAGKNVLNVKATMSKKICQFVAKILYFTSYFHLFKYTVSFSRYFTVCITYQLPLVQIRITVLSCCPCSATSLALPWLTQSVTILSQQRLRFNLRLVYVEFVMDKVAVVQVFLSVIWFSHWNTILPKLQLVLIYQPQSLSS